MAPELNDVFWLVIPNLGSVDALAARATCKTVQIAVGLHLTRLACKGEALNFAPSLFPNLRSLRTRSEDALSLTCLPGFLHLEQLSVFLDDNPLPYSRTFNVMNLVPHLQHLPSLKSLKVYKAPESHARILRGTSSALPVSPPIELTFFSGLRRLELHQCQFAPTLLPCLSSLQYLHLGGHTTCAGEIDLSGLTQLEHVVIDMCDWVNDGTVASIERTASLRCLKLTYCGSLTSRVMLSLERMTQLNSLSIMAYDSMKNSDVSVFSRLRGLTELSLSSFDLRGTRALTALSRLPSLRSLTLHSGMDQANHSELTAFSRLEELRVAFPFPHFLPQEHRISWQYLSGLVQLRSLHIWAARVDIEEFRHLRLLTSLRILDLSWSYGVHGNDHFHLPYPHLEHLTALRAGTIIISHESEWDM
jgi:Leucine-rich repeat (LRR) protein